MRALTAHSRGSSPAPRQIAPGVYLVTLGRGTAASNVYLVGSASTWTLVDAGWASSADAIRTAAGAVFGPGARLAAILLTHLHPDHSGSAGALARSWRVPVYVHPDELPMAAGRYLPQYAMPLDRWLVAPILRLLPARTRARIEAANNITDVVAPLDRQGGVPGLPDWAWIPTPGHTPGHVAYLRAHDGVLIGGDAALTVNLNSLGGVLLGRQRLAGPPRYTTWDWPAAQRSVRALADLEPRVLAPGHGRPLTTGTAAALAALAKGRPRPPPTPEAAGPGAPLQRQRPVSAATTVVRQAAVAWLRADLAGAQPQVRGDPGGPWAPLGGDPADQPGPAGPRGPAVSGRPGRGVAVGPQRAGGRWPGGVGAAPPAARGDPGRGAGARPGPAHLGLHAAGWAAARVRPGGPGGEGLLRGQRGADSGRARTRPQDGKRRR